MIKIIKKELNIRPYLKKKIMWAGKYTNINIEVIKGNLIRLEPTNMTYIESHKVIINGKDIFCINELNNQFRLCELIHYFKKTKSIL
ncbi:MAG: hypothetical protein PUB18_01450 [bacterium]|nr:hypothetical protein [bacterium]